MSIYAIIEKEKTFVVRADFNPDLHVRIKYHGGRWIQKGWEVPIEQLANIRTVLYRMFSMGKPLKVQITIKKLHVKPYLSLFYRNLITVNHMTNEFAIDPSVCIISGQLPHNWGITTDCRPNYYRCYFGKILAMFKDRFIIKNITIEVHNVAQWQVDDIVEANYKWLEKITVL